MGVYKTLRNNLLAVIQGIDGFQEVKKRPTLKFTGYPAAFIVPSGNDGEFQSTNDNQRIYTLKVWVFSEYDQTTADASYDEIMDRTDDVLEAIDKQENPELSSRSMANNLPSYATLIAVMAAPGQLVPDEHEKLLASEITVRCKITVDITQIS